MYWRHDTVLNSYIAALRLNHVYTVITQYKIYNVLKIIELDASLH